MASPTRSLSLERGGAPPPSCAAGRTELNGDWTPDTKCMQRLLGIWVVTIVTEIEVSMPKRVRCPNCDRLFGRDILDSHIQKCRIQSKRSHEETGLRRRNVVVDGNNIAYHLAPKGRPRAANLVLARRSLLSAGYRPIIVVSPALVHQVDKPNALRELIDVGHVIEAARGKNDDLFIIQTARKSNADIVSNDRFLDWQDRYPWISNRLRRYRMTPSGLILI
jgi:hypothetical protein